jgi:hypothetical protein
MTFKYFDRPEIITGLRENVTTCDLCDEDKLCFDAELFYGSEEISSICPECLANGELNDLDIFTCEGDIKELERQLKELNPSFSDAQVDELSEQKTTELEKTTPKVISWQDWSWPCSDGDYCKFIGYGSRPFYNRLSPSSNGRELFENSFYYRIKDASDGTLWDSLLAEDEINNYEESSEYGTLFYVFKSLNSDKVVTIWDCD